jgi:hypothetical protein
MPGFKLIKCSFLESLERLKYDPGLAKEEKSYEKNMDQIFSDIGRIGGFFPTNGKTFNDFVATWLKRKKVPATFIQGIFDASFYILSQHLFFDDSKDSKKLQPIYSLDLDPELEKASNKLAYFIQNQSEIALCYLDDQARPCGVFISCLKSIPSLWMAAVIHDTTADLADREVSLFFCEYMCDVEEGKFQAVNSRDASQAFLDSLGSHELQDVLKLCFQDDGSINTQTLGEIKTECIALRNPEQTIIKKKTEQYRKLKQKQQESINNEKNRHLEPQFEQPFLSRNLMSLGVGTVSLLFVVGIVLTLSGVFAPIGLTLIGSTAIALAISLLVLNLLVLSTSAGIILLKESNIEHQVEAYERKKRALKDDFERNCKQAMTAEYDFCLMASLPTDTKLIDYLYSYILIGNTLHYIDIEVGNTTPVIKKRSLADNELMELHSKLPQVIMIPEYYSDCRIYYLSLDQMKLLGIIGERDSQQRRLLESLTAPTNGINTTSKTSDSESPTSDSPTPRHDKLPDAQRENLTSGSNPSSSPEGTSSSPEGTSSSHDETSGSGSPHEYSSGEDSDESNHSARGYAMGNING